MLEESLTGPGAWPQPVLGVGTERIAAPSAARYRLSPSGKIFLVIVVVEALIVTIERFYTDIIWRLPAEASHGDLHPAQTSWLFICALISNGFTVLLAFDAVVNESRPALFACLGSSVFLSIRSVIEFSYKEAACSKAGLNFVCIPGLVEIVLYQVLIICLGLGKVITQMGFRFYRIVGADLALRDIYDRYVQFVTLFRLNQQLSLLVFVTTMYFSKSTLQILFVVLFVVLELVWEFMTVSAVHSEDHRLGTLALFASLITPIYTLIILIELSQLPFFFSALMLFSLFTFVLLGIASRAAIIYSLMRLAATRGQGFQSRILPKFNLLALGLPFHEAPFQLPAAILSDAEALAYAPLADHAPLAGDL